MKKLVKRIVVVCSILFIGGYAGVIGWYRLNEAKFIYYPKKASAALPDNIASKYQLVEVASSDSVKLVCLMTRSPVNDSSRFWVLYFHGNSGNIFGSLARPEMLDSAGAKVFSVDYRGYGGSTGTPSEEGLYQDAKACYGYLTGVLHVPPERIVLYGYSLGSGVATKLAVDAKVAGLIIEGAFESLPRAGQKDYPLLPLSLMMGQTFASIDRIDKITAPMLIIHARNDRVVPFSQGRALYDKAVAPKTFLELPGGHNDAPRYKDKIVPSVSAFLAILRRDVEKVKGL